MEEAPIEHKRLQTICTVCNLKPAIYTCPCCGVRSCSASCVGTHKRSTGCSGIRNRAAYVPMREYGYGTLMSDYVFLEDMGRHVADVGKEIVRARLAPVLAAPVARGMAARGRGGRNPGRNQGSKADARRQTLRRQLELWDIDLELLPSEMAKAKLNRSSWDFKNKCALLTIEFRIHPVPLPPALRHTVSASSQPFTLFSHQSSMSATLASIIQQEVDRINVRKGNTASIPEWVHALLVPTPEDPEGFEPPQYLMRAEDALPSLSVVPPRTPTGKCFFELDPSRTLSSLLRGAHFIEFPTIEIWPRGSFSGIIVAADGTTTHTRRNDGTDEPARKRPRLDTNAAKKVMSGMLGGYGSSDEEKEEDDLQREDAGASLSRLGTYGEVDDEDLPNTSENLPLANDNADAEDVASVEEAGDDDDEVESSVEEDDDYRQLLASLPPMELPELPDEGDENDADMDDDALGVSDDENIHHG